MAYQSETFRFTREEYVRSRRVATPQPIELDDGFYLYRRVEVARAGGGRRSFIAFVPCHGQMKGRRSNDH